MAKHYYQEDDGRTVVDMSGVERTPLLIPRLRKNEKKAVISDPEEQPEEGEDKPWLASEGKLNKQERRWFINGALGATAAIAAVYLVAAFLFIFILTKVL
ncbi:MAG: hypothetical protein IJ168_08935 [Eubacterium sp.]|nr:hypothetical protein [Eubacterium sp.]